jgi:hypothetical protein
MRWKVPPVKEMIVAGIEILHRQAAREGVASDCDYGVVLQQASDLPVYLPASPEAQSTGQQQGK